MKELAFAICVAISVSAGADLGGDGSPPRPEPVAPSPGAHRWQHGHGRGGRLLLHATTVTVLTKSPGIGCTALIRDLAGNVVASGVTDASIPESMGYVWSATPGRGFYYIRITNPYRVPKVSVLVGQTDHTIGRGFYNIKSTGDPYGNTSEWFDWKLRGNFGLRHSLENKGNETAPT